MAAYPTTRATPARRRPIGASCTWCRVRPAQADRRWPHLATNWCCDAHKFAEHRARVNARREDLANDLRRALGLADDRGPDFTAPELAAMLRRLRRLVPYSGGAVGASVAELPPRRSAVAQEIVRARCSDRTPALAPRRSTPT